MLQKGKHTVRDDISASGDRVMVEVSNVFVLLVTHKGFVPTNRVAFLVCRQH